MHKYQDYHLESPEVIIVEASAGTGKTYELAKRYIQLIINTSLQNRISPDNILAITFTNKATKEMKERILELLKKMALNCLSPQEEKAILPFLNIDKEKIREKASKITDELIKNYSLFQVQTIDSFINTILLSSALKIDRSANFKIKKEYTQYLSYSLDAAIDEAKKEKKLLKVFEEFIDYYLFIENHSSWFPRQNILNTIKFLFFLNNYNGYDFVVHDTPNSEILQTKIKLYNVIKKSIDGAKKLNKSILKFIEENGKHFSLKNLPSSLLKENYLSDKKKKMVSNLIRKLAEMEAHKTFSPYIKLFMIVLKELHKISQKEDVLFLEELNKKTYLLINKEMGIPELYYRMSMRFYHYLIDEFQDTSLLQWLNLKPMIEDALSSGGTLFYVGDKKQAIYRFRGGETRLFDDIKYEFRHFNPKIRFLKKNWRSQKEIVEFNNEIFSPQNLKRALLNIDLFKEDPFAINKILDIFKDSHQEYDPNNKYGYVKVEKIEKANSKETKEIIYPKLINTIIELRRRFAYRDIAILCRNNNELEETTAKLLENDIPVESEKTLITTENPLIKEIISFLSFLHSPIDDISFASFIMGEIFRRKTNVTFKEITDFLFTINKEKNHYTDFSLYRYFREKYPLIWKNHIDIFFKNVGFLSLYELTISIYSHFEVLDNFENEQAFFMKLLELIKEKEEEYLGLEEFLSYLSSAPKDDLYVNTPETDSVHILTIHKAKGLEFPVVILPFLGIEIVPQYGDRRNNCFLNRHKDKLELLRINKEHRLSSRKLYEVYKNAYIDSLIDELNAMYVAFTRPRWELYIFLPYKTGNSYNKARYFIEEENYQKGNPHHYKHHRKKPNIKKLAPFKYHNWINSLKDEIISKNELINRENIIYGNVMHFALSFIGNLSGTNTDTLIKNIIEKIRRRFPSVKADAYKKELLRIIQEDKLFPFFYLEEGRVYTEKEIVAEDGRIMRIDRLIIKDKEVWIIDYKTSHNPTIEDKNQLREYIKTISNIYSEYKIKGFLIYLQTMEVKEVR